VRTFAAILTSIVCGGCAITREQAVAVATRVIVERKFPLPAHYTVDVIEGSHAQHGASTLWGVEFRAPGRAESLYEVWVQKSSGTVDGFTDYVLEEPVSPHDR
jgi:hypothetical protein